MSGWPAIISVSQSQVVVKVKASERAYTAENDIQEVNLPAFHATKDDVLKITALNFVRCARV